MVVFFVVFALMNGRIELSHVMGLKKQDKAERQVGPNGPAGTNPV
jgi:hypothetical protein